MQRGLLLANLGSPDACDVPAVRRYLNEFLMDRHVLDLPWPLRRLVVSAFILPTRPKRSAAAYQAIWRDVAPGSPLIHHTLALAARLRRFTEAPVAVGMRFGSPGLAQALEELSAANEIFLVPLFPQHAASTRVTTVAQVRRSTAKAVRVMPPFHGDAGFLDASAERLRATMAPGDHVLFSYHGLPERHVRRADPTGSHCLAQSGCCDAPSAASGTCYRYQCLATSRALAERLGLHHHSTSFQSRLGRLPWLAPYTDQTLAELPARGVRRPTVACPAFVADNLETLEEIGIRGRATFLNAGGEAFRLAPCLNDDAAWARTIAGWCESPPPEAPFDAPAP